MFLNLYHSNFTQKKSFSVDFPRNINLTNFSFCFTVFVKPKNANIFYFLDILK